MAVAFRNVEDATPDDGSPPSTRTIFPTCRAHYPGGSSGCTCQLLTNARWSLSRMAGGSISALLLSRPAYDLRCVSPDRSTAQSTLSGWNPLHRYFHRHL